MSLAKNILPAVYSGVNKVGAGPQGGVACGAGGGFPPRAAPHSISQRDKKLLLLQEQTELKKKQIIEDYRHIKNNVKENPYLQTVVTEYDKYFELQHKQIQALKALLQNVNKKEDKMEIKREIAALEKNLA